MQGGLLSVLLFGLILGIKHATEPDHIIAVSTIASRTRKLSMSSLVGAFWGLGHTATLLVIGMAVIGLQQHIPEKLALSLEFFVGIMLVYLGVSGLRPRKHHHAHTFGQGDMKKFHLKSFFIGTIHGLAGSAALVLLTMATVKSAVEAFEFILVFGAGTILGMFLFTTVLGMSFIWATSRQAVHSFITKAASTLSAVYGVYYMYQIAIVDKLFQL
jgi:hypothetical protein